MPRLLSVLLFLLATRALCQETVATIEPKFGVGDPEVFFMGDTMLVRLIFDKQKTARRGSEAAWYAGTNKIADVDLMTLGSNNLIAVKQYGDSLYYYSAEDAGKKIDIDIYKGSGMTSVVPASKASVTGVLINAIHRGHNLMIITWERKATTFHLYEFNRSKLVNTRDFKMARDLAEIREGDVVFIDAGDPSRVSSSAVPFKVFVYGDTFCAVYDDAWREQVLDEKPGYKTRVFRKNLVTGKEDNDLFFTAEKYNFKSYLGGKDGKDLYRIVTTRNDVTLFVHDLDSNKLIIQQKIDVVKEQPGLERWGAQHKLQRHEAPDLRSDMASKFHDMGIIVDNYADDQIVTFGYFDNSKGVGAMPGGAMIHPVLRIAVLLVTTAIKQLKDDTNHIRYGYLQGNSGSGFKVLPANGARDFIKTRIDEFELQLQSNANIDHLAYFAGKKCWIAIHSNANSLHFTITRFSLKL